MFRTFCFRFTKPWKILMKKEHYKGRIKDCLRWRGSLLLGEYTASESLVDLLFTKLKSGFLSKGIFVRDEATCRNWRHESERKNGNENKLS